MNFWDEDRTMNTTELPCYDAKTFSGTLDERWAHVRSLELDTRTGWKRRGRLVLVAAQAVAVIRTRVQYGGETLPQLFHERDTYPVGH